MSSGAVSKHGQASADSLVQYALSGLRCRHQPAEAAADRGGQGRADEFRDINAEPAALARYGIGLEDIRRRLHATDAGGKLLVGADVAVAAWLITPGEGWLATLFGNPATLPLTRYAYDRFADLLYAWNRRKGRW